MSLFYIVDLESLGVNADTLEEAQKKAEAMVGEINHLILIANESEADPDLPEINVAGVIKDDYKEEDG